MEIELESCKAAKVDWLNEFYRKVGYGRSIADGDDIYFAKENGQAIGVVRISHEHDCQVLRGMQVLESFQGQGIGTRLLFFLESGLGAGPVYCIPHDHLVKFYEKIGFAEICPDKAPEFLAERLNSYLESGHHVLIMKREADS